MATRLDRKLNGKLEDKGNVCIMVGYAENHAGDAYCMLNLKTKQISVSRDVCWLGKSYGDYMKLKDSPEVEDVDEEDEDNENNKKEKEVRFEIPSTSRTLNSLEIETDEGFGSVDERAESGRVLRSGREIGNIAVPISWEDFSKCNMALMAGSVDEVKYEPKTFQEAWWLEDLEEREKWRTAIRKEFHDMIRRGVWRKRSRAGVPDGRTTVKCKWVFKIKRNGVYRARLVACGYSQVPGVDFTENFSPVVNDVTFRMVLILMMLNQYKCKLIDVETAFLEGDLEEEIFMDVPDGYKEVLNEETAGECLRLERPLYGLVQAARQFWKKAVGVLKEIGFVGGQADPCLMTKTSDEGTVHVIMYVDDFYALLISMP